jgi:hypothetical protein
LLNNIAEDDQNIDEIIKNKDYYCLSGTFHTKKDNPIEDWTRFVITATENMFKMAKKGICVNFLPSYSDFCDNRLCYCDPRRVTDYNPLFAAGTAFLVIDDIWPTWYNSSIRWEKTKQGLKQYYGIHHATSVNEIDWICDPGVSRSFADEYEYASGRPSVVIIEGRYCMWFAHTATKDIESYRMGFASSSDGLKWERDDTLAGIDVSPEGWDSEMICYP